MEITGKIKEIMPEVQVSATFKKRELVVQTNEQYPQSILIEFHQDKCDLLNLYTKGEEITVGINLRGREWVNPNGETKYFNSIGGWKITKPDGSSNTKPQSNPTNTAPANQASPQPASNEEEHDDLPF